RASSLPSGGYEMASKNMSLSFNYSRTNRFHKIPASSPGGRQVAAEKPFSIVVVAFVFKHTKYLYETLSDLFKSQ
ncbi:hypothetical protein ACQ9LF_12760, partial [Anaerohalosphaeraceae bacterium U12dextr]